MIPTLDVQKRGPYDVVLRPIITEKTVELSADNKYTFEVDLRANKCEIRGAIEHIFRDKKVKVCKVNTVRVKGKPRRWGRRYHGRRSDWKKAIVSLRPGDKIDIKGLNYFDQ